MFCVIFRHADAGGQKRAEEVQLSGDSAKKQRAGEGTELFDDDQLLDDSDVGQQTPKTPKLENDVYNQKCQCSDKHRPWLV